MDLSCTVMGHELEVLRQGAVVASERLAAGEQGPLTFGVCSSEMYSRLCNVVSPACRLEWIPKGDGPMGFVRYCGDPQGPHEGIIRHLEGIILLMCAAQQCRPTALGSLTTLIPWSGGSTRTGRSQYSWGKEPDLCYQRPGASPTELPVLAIEVVFKNESQTEMTRVAARWAAAGVHALVVKVFLPPSAKTMTAIFNAASFLFILQEARTQHWKVWREGAAARDFRLPPGTTPLEEMGAGPLVLPVSWFGATTNDVYEVPIAADDPRKVILSGHHLRKVLYTTCWEEQESSQASLKRDLNIRTQAAFRAELQGTSSASPEVKTALQDLHY
ncbi:unnamed protein product [Parajaminaea phylloscopi]